MEHIKFYRATGDYGEFSNFSDYSVKIDGKVWPTTEHYFQAMKFDSLSDQAEIRKANTPYDAAQKGRSRKRKLKKNWESIKCDVMKKALAAKFSQYDNLKNLLIGTGDAVLVEHTSNDSFWGDGGHGRGRNMLGILLMELREEIRLMELNN